MVEVEIAEDSVVRRRYRYVEEDDDDDDDEGIDVGGEMDGGVSGAFALLGLFRGCLAPSR